MGRSRTNHLCSKKAPIKMAKKIANKETTKDRIIRLEDELEDARGALEI